MLPDDFAKASKVVGEEPTALREVVRRLQVGRSERSLPPSDIQLHGQVCLRLAGGADVSVCMEVCPDTWAERREVKLHVHAFLKSNSKDLRVRNLTPFSFGTVKPNVSVTIGGMPIQANGRSSWSGFSIAASVTRLGHCSAWRRRCQSKDFWYSRIGF